MPASAFKLNPALRAQWSAAIHELASIAKKDDPESVQKLVMLSARRFVKNVAAITPPARVTLENAAKKRGEAAILSDLLKIALPTTVVGTSRQAREALASATELLAVHARSLTKGRVKAREQNDKLLVSQTTFNQTLKLLQSRVGWLAAGLNAAAAKLGFTLPAWIKRHGQKYGAIEVAASSGGLRVRIIQNVPFADDVGGYSSKWDFALQKEINALVNQVKAIFARKAARAAARLRK